MTVFPLKRLDPVRAEAVVSVVSLIRAAAPAFCR
jgi:hypothetical protein